MRRQYRSSQRHIHSALEDDTQSPLQAERAFWQPALPDILKGVVVAEEIKDGNQKIADEELLKNIFTETFGQPLVHLKSTERTEQWNNHPPLRIGVVLSVSYRKLNNFLFL